MTWEEAEALYPGCSALWDIRCLDAVGVWTVESVYQTTRSDLTVLVYSTVAEFPRKMYTDMPYRWRMVDACWNLFQFSVACQTWWSID